MMSSVSRFIFFFFSSRRRHTRCALVTGVQTCALPISGQHVAALRVLAGAVDAAYGRHLTINATGATAALLGDIGVPTELMRGFAVVSRAAGLIAHIAEEQQSPSGMFIWDLVDRSIPHAEIGRAHV